MADNNADFTKKILVDIELKADQVKKDLPAILKEIQDLTDAQKILEVQGQKNGKQWVNNAASIRQLKGEVREINKAIDNTAKALHAENNSIAQNRALLSLLTAEHIKLGQANGDSKAKIDASAKSINDLTTVLKAQEKAIGQTYRNVGNYEEAIRNVANELGRAIPGFQQFSSAINVVGGFGEFIPKAFDSASSSIQNFASGISTASQKMTSFVGFKQFGAQAEKAEAETADLSSSVSDLSENVGQVQEGAEKAVAGFKQFTGAATELTATSSAGAVATGELAVGEAAAGAAAQGATGGVSALNIAVGAVIGVIAAVVVAIYGLVQYLKTLDSVGDRTSQVWAGMKASFTAAADSMRAGDWKGLIKNMHDADFEARHFTEAMQDLGDAMLATEVHSAKAEAAIADLMLKMRNRRISPEQEQQYFNQIQAISTKNYEERKKNADELYKIAIREAENGKYLTAQEKKNLRERGVDYAIYLENNDKISSGSYQKIAEAQKQQIAADAFYQSVKERAQNRLDAKLDQAAQKQQAAAEKERQLLQKQTDAYLESENILKSSHAKELQAIYENYGDQVLAADQHYNDEITKLKKFRDKKLITQAQYNRVETQLSKEHAGEVQRIIDQFNREDLEKYRQATNELINLRIQNIDDDTKRTVAGLKQRGIEQEQELTNQNAEHLRNVKALDLEIANLDGAEKAEAQERRDNEISLIELNEGKRIALAKSTAKQIATVNRNAARERQAAEDEAAVLKAKRGSNIFTSGGAKSAEMQAISNRYDFEIAEAARAGRSTVLLEQQKIEALKQINDQYRNEKVAYAAEAEQMVQGSVFDILSQNLQQQSEAKLNQLSQSKDAELNNTSLTNTERRLIEQKYKKLEDAEKVRAFKANQKLQAANILINGAVGISKTIAEMGFLPAIPFVALTVASTALQIGKVLSAKPGFADGGEFKSDGKGALLPGYSRKDNTNAYLRSGEAVVVSEAMQAPWARNIVSDINVMFGGRSFATPGHQKAFATGGLFTDGGNANRYYSAPVYDSEALANSMAYQLINNFPAVYVDVKDINNQQSIRAQTINRVDL